MAYIVEMWWGRAHQLIVDDVDESGEPIQYTIPTAGPRDPERRTFSCHADNWKAAQAIAKQYGWTPKGALFFSWKDRTAPPVRDMSYEPDGWLRGIHEVDPDDAKAWSSALAAAIADIDAGRFDLQQGESALLLREGMTLDEFRQANRGLTPTFLRAFAAFAATGPFRFGWDS